MIKTLRSKLILIHIITQFLFLIVFIALGSVFVNRTFEVEFAKRVRSFQFQTESALTVAFLSFDTATLKAVAEEVIHVPDIYEFSVYIQDKLIHQATSKINSSQFLDKIIYPVVVQGQTIGRFEYSISKYEIEKSRSDIMTRLWILSLIEIVLMSGIAFLIGSYLGKRTKRLEAGLNAYSTGDVFFRFSNVSDDELGFVENSFNSLAAAIEEKNNHLESLQIQNMANAKMASLGEMAGSVAHEINNPLSVISMRAELILKNISGPKINIEKATEDIHKIEGTIDRIAKIVKGLRSFSRSGASDPMSKVSLKLVVEDSLSLCQEKFKNHSTQLTFENLIPDRVFVNGREVQLSQVVLNLLNNAYDAIFESENRWVKIKLMLKKSVVQIEIIDSGAGIPENVLEKIMVPFFSTKEVGKGTGLGLSISKGIIEDHKGKLYYKLIDGHTAFVIELPQYSGD